MWDHFFPLLFPKDSESLKIFDIRLWEVGAKRPLNGTSKVNRHTNTHMDISTYRKHRPRGPMLWKYEAEAEAEQLSTLWVKPLERVFVASLTQQVCLERKTSLIQTLNVWGYISSTLTKESYKRKFYSYIFSSIITRRYSPLRGLTSSSCWGLRPLAEAFFALRAKKSLLCCFGPFLAIFGVQ